MDANGTKFHLLFQEDWESCILMPRGLPLNAVPEENEATPAEIEYDARASVLQLRAEKPEFRRFQRTRSGAGAGVSPSLTGGAQDRYGNWYWISDDGREIRVQTVGSRGSVRFWGVDEDTATVQDAPGDFHPPEVASVMKAAGVDSSTLYGVAISDDNYVLAGVKTAVAQGATPTADAIIAIDLITRRTQRLTPPADTQHAFSVDAICPAVGSGAWILDNSNQIFWRLYTTPHTLPGAADDLGGNFQPIISDGIAPAPTQGFILQSFDKISFATIPDLHSTITIKRGPAGRLLALTTTDNNTKSHVIDISIDLDLTPHTIDFTVHPLLVVITNPVTNASDDVSLRALDITYVEYTADCDSDWLTLPLKPDERVPVLLAVDGDMDQALAYEITNADDPAKASLNFIRDLLPMRRWGGRALVTAGCRVYYDFGETWLPLQYFGEPHFVMRGIITTPIDFPADLPDQPFDGGQYGCVWHRLVIDAEIPAGTNVGIRARAADSPDILDDMPWLDQPSLYLRGDGAELPFYTPPIFRAPDPAAHPPDEPLDDNCLPGAPFQKQLKERRAGSWELLFQNVVGRYLQLEITLEGSGRVTPQLYALRAWYPRFSYMEHYLPAIYRENPYHASFLDRWLANIEGMFTHLEDQIDRIPSLLDPRITPPETLEWLAGWLGLLLAPEWTEKRQRFFIRHAMDLYRLRGTPLGLHIALRLYLDDESQINDSLFRRDTPQSWRVRLSENFLTVYVNAPDPTQLLDPVVRHDLQRDVAHQFRVIVPSSLTLHEERMIRRIVDMEKPAHTEYTVEPGVDALIIGCAILDVDMVLCDAPPALLLQGLDSQALDRLVLPYVEPLPDQTVLDRDILF